MIAKVSIRRNAILTVTILCIAIFTACGGGSSEGSASEEELSTELLQGRGEHTTTLLPDGRLLAVGGRSDATSLNSTEIFDPSTQSWSAAEDMEYERFDHSAVLLKNGQVLISGGDKMATGGGWYKRDDSTAIKPSALYDPASGNWTTTGSTVNEHGTGHTATLLDNGQVLITGGLYEALAETPRVPSSFTELFDPSTGTWKNTGEMNEARYRHKAVLLENGNVLVIGGTSWEIYETSSGTWSETGQLPNDHGIQFTATELSDGRILVAGGGHSETVEDTEIAPPSPISNADIYDQSDGVWSSVADMINPDVGHTATLLSDGTLLLVGPVSSQLYNPEADSWSDAGQLSIQRGAPMIGGPADAFHTATLMNDNKVVIVGGVTLELNKFGALNDREPISTIDIYNPASGWE